MILARWLHLAGPLLLVTLGRGSAAFLAALAVVVLAKKLSSETRHLVWLGVIVGFLLIPAAWTMLPAVRIGSRIPLPPSAPLRLAAAPVLSRADYELLLERARQASPAPRVRPEPLRGASSAIVIAWSLGVAFLTTRTLVGRRRLRRLMASAGGDARVQMMSDELGRQPAIRRRVLVLLSPSCRIPFGLGLLRPRILLPREAASWSAARLRSTLTHELTHIRRCDLAAQSFGYAVCILSWFAPPIWLAYAAMLREAETCCDQQVVEQGIRAPDYARDIVELARSCRGRILFTPVSAALRSRSGLRERVTKILSLKPGRRPFGRRAAVRVLVICLACAAPFLALTAQVRPLLLQPTDPLFGTWVNPAYERNIVGVAAKSVFFADGSAFDYRKVGDREPFSAGNFSVDSVWVDAEGDHWYKLGWVGDDYPMPWKEPRFKCRVLARVNAAGNWLDFIAGQSRYPESFKDVVCGVPLQYQRQ
jgi:beta-lactamase regulating signal transducer with metallopeptidase domain